MKQIDNYSFLFFTHFRKFILSILFVHTFILQSEHNWHERQPDGGRLESCVLIDLANVHSTNHWHDVPCVSDNEANQYICMKPAQSK